MGGFCGGGGFNWDVDLSDICDSFFGGGGGHSISQGFGDWWMGAGARIRGLATGHDLRCNLKILF